MYRCPTCGIEDAEAYHRCYHPACPDGRDQWRNRCQQVRTDGPTPCHMGRGCDCLKRPASGKGWLLAFLALLVLWIGLGWYCVVHREPACPPVCSTPARYEAKCTC